PAPKKLVEVQSNERTYVGVSASSGVVVGKISVLKEEEFLFDKEASDLDAQRLLLENSILAAAEELQEIEQRLGLDQKDKAAIFSAHREMLSDPELIEECVQHINKGLSAAFSWDQTIKDRAHRLESLKNELIAGRANDIRDIGKRVLKKILGITDSAKELEDNIILVAEDLTPSDTIQLDKKKVLGFCTTSGGATSHVAILARSIGIPAIAGIEHRALDLKNGTEVILDGDHGALYIGPTDEEKATVKSRQEKLEVKKKAALNSANEAATTKDGHRVEVVANISGVSDAEKSVELGGEGVGLLRTEFLFLERDQAPSEDEQLEIYQGIVDALGERPLVIRTLDIGGDKSVNYLPMNKEENPFLGVRGIRLCFQREDLFRTQLRAILKVRSKTPINLMFPMIGQLSELRLAKKILEEERVALDAPQLKIGIMIEVPSAAVMAEQFAKEVDFFSVGTNDLTQYTMAMDRGHNELAKQVDGLHPSVLNLIKMTVDAAHKYGKWVGVCGGIASELKALPVLLALGVDELSLSIPNIPMIKAAVRELDKKECESLCQDFLMAESGKEVREIVINKWPHLT
ncbi:MAG: phosphocarrier protein FPr, partial [Bacteriovoracaceae bacterium]